MRILTFDELTASMHLDRALLHATAFGGGFPRRAVEIYRRRLRLLPDYVGLFAVEHGHVVGQMFVLRIPYDFRDGPGRMSGIAGVATRPDRGHRGVAKSLLAEVHERERRDGLEYAALWTNRAWVAHGFYEKFGYRDVYSAPWAIHDAWVGPSASAPAISLRRGRTDDLDELDTLRERAALGRLGYVRRPEGNGRASALAGDLDPSKTLIVAREGSGIVGYAHVDRTSNRAVCGELVARDRSVQRVLMNAVASGRPRVPYAFQHTMVTDSPSLFHGHGFTMIPNGWYGMMAADLNATWTRRAAVSKFATDDPRFVCQAGDRF